MRSRIRKWVSNMSEPSYDNTDRLTLYDKYKLVEKTEPEVNGVWKGAHLVLFFLAFVFGSFCTFCFHMLMYLFDEKCVLFPKLLSLSSLRQNIIYEFLPEDKDAANMLPVDFLSTQWVEQSTCLLPTYVPLVSGIFGLVWTTMFLMCSIGSRVLTGLQRPWRVLPPVFLFSIAMGSVCVYTSAFTHYGLQELCVKLNEITGKPSCSYEINVATLAYQRRIRGLYQATQLTITSAWLHTACWLLSALLALLRVLLVVDFKLVRVTVELQGNIDRMLERHERQISTILPSWADMGMSIPQPTHGVRNHFLRKLIQPKLVDSEYGDILYRTELHQDSSDLGLVSTELLKLYRQNAINAVPTEYQFIVTLLHRIIDNIDPQSLDSSSDISASDLDIVSPITRQFGQQNIASALSIQHSKKFEKMIPGDMQLIAKEIKRLQSGHNREPNELKIIHESPPKRIAFKSSMTLFTSEISLNVIKDIATETELEPTEYSQPSTSKGKEPTLVSNLRQTGVQTDEKEKDKSSIVKKDSDTSMCDSITSLSKETRVKTTQTKKEKQD